MQSFHTLDVFSVISGRMLKDMDGIYDVLEFFVGRRPFTRELSDFADAFSPIIIAQIPESKKYINIVNSLCSKDKVKEAWTELFQKFGESITLTK